MSFNTDPSKEAQKVAFQRRLQKRIIIPYISNNMPLTQTIVQNHIEMYLDEKINCNTHIKEKLSKVYKDTGLFRSLSRNFQDKLFLQCIRRLQGHILAMVLLCMISQTMKHSLINSRKHNMIQHYRDISMLNLALNLLNLGNGLGNLLVLIISSLKDYLIIYFH